MVRAQLAREDTLVVAARDKEEAALLGLAVFTMECRSGSRGQQRLTVCKSKYFPCSESECDYSSVPEEEGEEEEEEVTIDRVMPHKLRRIFSFISMMRSRAGLPGANTWAEVPLTSAN